MLNSIRKCHVYIAWTLSKKLLSSSYKVTPVITNFSTVKTPFKGAIGNSGPTVPVQSPNIAINLKDLQELIVQSRKSQKLNVDLLEAIIENSRISAKQRLNLMSEVFEAATKSIILLDEEHFLLKLKCYLKCRGKLSPKLFLKEVNAAGVEVSEKMLHLLLAVVCEQGDPGYVSAVISAFRSRNILPNDHMFGCLIIAHAVKGDKAGVRQVLQNMTEVSLSPGPHTYTSLMRAAAMAGDFSALYAAKTACEENKVKLTSKQILSVVETAVVHKKDILLPAIVGTSSICTAKEISTLVEELIFSGATVGAYSVLKLLPRETLFEASRKFIEDMVAAETPFRETLYVGKKMVEEKLHPRALYDILERSLLNGQSEPAVATLQACQEVGLAVRPHFFWPLIVLNHRKDADKGVFHVLELMTSMQVTADVETLSEFVLPRITLDDSDAVLKRIQDATQLHISQLFTPFAAHLLRMGHLKQVLELGKRYESCVPKADISVLSAALVSGYKVTRDAGTTAELMQMLGINVIGEWLAGVFSTRIWLPANQCIELFKCLRAVGLAITPVEERQLQRLLQKSQSYHYDVEAALKELVDDNQVVYSTGSPIPHPSEMNANQLENHVKELEGKGMNTRGALRKLVQKSCREGKLEEAQQAFNRLQELETFLSPGILSAMLEVNVKAGKPDEALKFLKDIEGNFPEFRMDSYKLIDLARVMVLDGRFEEALNLIHSRPQKPVPTALYPKWERNCWALLSACASLNVNAVSQMLDSLLKHKYCLPSNVVLGPIVKVHIDSGNVEEAVNIFQSFNKKYKKAPQQQELMLAALSSQDPSLLDAVVKGSTAVHGLPSTQAVLVSALAIKGDVAELKKLLQSMNAGATAEHLKRQLERHRDLGQIKALQTTLSACFDLPIVDNDLVVSCIIYHYQRTGAVEEAMEWWSSLESKGIELSDKHKSALSSLLISQKS